MSAYLGAAANTRSATYVPTIPSTNADVKGNVSVSRRMGVRSCLRAIANPDLGECFRTAASSFSRPDIVKTMSHT